MIEPLLIAAGVAAGADRRGMAVLASAIVFPIPTGILMLLLVLRWQGAVSNRGVMFCDAVAGELRAGDSLRNALEASATSLDLEELATMCREGNSFSAIGRSLRNAFPEVGQELEVVLERAASTSAPRAELFEEVANVASAERTVALEVRAATSPARATAAFLMGGLVLGIYFALSGRDVGLYLVDPAQRVAVVVGLAMVLGGLAAAFWLMLRAR